MFLFLWLTMTFFVCAQEIGCEVKVSNGKPQLFLYKNSLETTRGSLFQSGLLAGEFRLTGKAKSQVVWAALRMKTINLQGTVVSTSQGNWQIEVPLDVEQTTILSEIFQESQMLLRAWLAYGDYLDNAKPGKIVFHWDTLQPFLMQKNVGTARQLEAAVLEAMGQRMIEISESGDAWVAAIVYYLRRTLYSYVLDDGNVRLSYQGKKKMRGNSELDCRGPFYVEREILLQVMTPQAAWKEHVTENLLGGATGTRVQKVQFCVPFDLSPWNIQKIAVFTELETPKGVVPGKLVMLDKADELKSIAFTVNDPGQCKLYYFGKIFKTDRTQVAIPRTRIHNPPFNFSVPVHTESLGDKIAELLENKE
jgi:hypothetical protein